MLLKLACTQELCTSSQGEVLYSCTALRIALTLASLAGTSVLKWVHASLYFFHLQLSRVPSVSFYALKRIPLSYFYYTGGLLAAAISNMDGVGGKTGNTHCSLVGCKLRCFQGWQWIFILEGLATIIIAVISYWIIPDFPSSPRVKFLTEEEREDKS